MIKSALFSEDRKHRYWLIRIWDDRPRLCIVGLNPSTADENKDDNTIRKCIRLAKKWGYGGIVMVNIFGYRSTDPKKMKEVGDPIGDKSNFWIDFSGACSRDILLAWGNHGEHLNRGNDVINGLSIYGQLYCLGKNKNGTPKHPLYLKEKDLKMEKFTNE